jgi:hypothetical protein
VATEAEDARDVALVEDLEGGDVAGAGEVDQVRVPA